MEQYPLVSVYTCVYNGASTIERVFSSMHELDYPNIEHIIVNDGSTDETEALVDAYRKTVPFPVKYHKKENGGKHTALNAVWSLAEGFFMIQLDADDMLLPHCVRFLVDTYFQIPENIRDQYWCVHGRCITQHQEFVGDPYPEHLNQQSWQDAGREAAKYRGEKIGLQVRSYLIPYRFPEIKGTSYVSEGIIWDQINREYGTWYTNEVVRVYYVGEGGNLTARKTKRRHFAPPCYRLKWNIMHPQWYHISAKDLFRYSLFYYLAHRDYRKYNPYVKDLPRHRGILSLFSLITFPCAFMLRILKKIR